MQTIIAPGTHNWETEIGKSEEVCNRCGCFFRFSIRDMKCRVYRAGRVVDGDVECPQCGYQIRITKPYQLYQQ